MRERAGEWVKYKNIPSHFMGSLRGAKPLLTNYYSLSLGRKGGQASNEDLLPLGYGERDRAGVRVNTN
jgi:hypothetical protein